MLHSAKATSGPRYLKPVLCTVTSSINLNKTLLWVLSLSSVCRKHEKTHRCQAEVSLLVILLYHNLPCVPLDPGPICWECLYPANIRVCRGLEHNTNAYKPLDDHGCMFQSSTGLLRPQRHVIKNQLLTPVVNLYIYSTTPHPYVLTSSYFNLKISVHLIWYLL